LLSRQNKHLDVIVLLRARLQVSKRYVPAWLLLIHAEIAENHLQQAGKNIAAIKPIVTDKTKLALLEGHYHNRKGNYQQAIDILQTAWKQDESNTSLAAELALTLAKNKQVATAVTVIDNARKANPDAHKLTLVAANIAEQQQQFDKVIALANAFPNKDNHARALQLILRAHDALKQWQPALAISTQLKNLQPKNPHWLIANAYYLGKLNKLLQIEFMLAKSIRHFQTPQQLLHMAMPWCERRELTLCEELLKLGFAKFPEHSELKRVLATAYALNSKPGRAEFLLRELVQSHPKDFMALNNLASLLGEQTATRSEALTLAERAFTIAPDNHVVLATVGWLYHLSGQHQRANPLLVKAMRTNHVSAEVRCQLGLNWYALGKFTQAKPELSRCAESTAKSSLQQQAKQLLENQ